jgi:putative transposase
MKHIAGQYYHVYNRGVEKRKIFVKDENYRFLLRRITEFIPEYAVTFIAYCLMPNHYHFLIRSEEDGSIGLFLQRLFNSKSACLFHISRYIHLNPVVAWLVKRPEDWQYSNYR